VNDAGAFSKGLRLWRGLWRALWGCALLAATQSVGMAEDFLDPAVAFRPVVQALDDHTLEIRFTIAPGYYLYRDRFRFTSEGPPLGDAEIPQGKEKVDDTYGQVQVFYDAVAIRLPVARNASGVLTFPVTVRSQGCADLGLCYPPQTHTLVANLPAEAMISGKPASLSASGKYREATAASPDSADAILIAPDVSGPGREHAARMAVALPSSSADMPSAGDEATSADAKDESGAFARLLTTPGLWGKLALFFVAGLGLALTPCMFPMLPILSGIIAGQAGTPDRRRAFWLSFFYVFGMALVYAAAGVAAGFSGILLAALLQNVWTLSFLALVFVLLALAMFGAYTLQVPVALQGLIAHYSRRFTGGHFVAVFCMGALSALIVGPCVAAPLAGALLYIGQGGDALVGGLALFVMAWGMGTPLLILGISAGVLLPRAGAWMDAVKKGFGFLLLIMALWVVSPVVSGSLIMAGYGLVLVFAALFLRALGRLPPEAGLRAYACKAIGVALLLWGVAMGVGALSGATNPLQPLAGFRATSHQLAGDYAAEPLFARVTTLNELDARLAGAASAGRPAILDFYADWCVSCKEMERETFAHPAVRAQLDSFVRLQVDVTANRETDHELLRRFRLFGPPGIIFFDRTGVEIPGIRVVGFQNAERFLDTLRHALAETR
jgi:thiol:disulfide interchange protein DsbD